MTTCSIFIPGRIGITLFFGFAIRKTPSRDEKSCGKEEEAGVEVHGGH